MKKFNKYKTNCSIVNSNGKDYVKSYETLVAEIDYVNKKVIEIGKWSSTTTKHVNYASRELGFELVKYKLKKIVEETNHTFDMMNIFLKLGSLVEHKNTLQEKVAYKERIIFSTMRNSIPNWEQPNDWSKISLEEKLERLNLIEKAIK
jgi:hypothetical protein